MRDADDAGTEVPAAASDAAAGPGGAGEGGPVLPAGFFAELPDRVRRTLLAAAVERRFAAGETLFRAGAPAQTMYVVLDGRVRVLRAGGGRPHVLHEEGPGGTLGEVPLLEGLPAAASGAGAGEAAASERAPRGGYPATAVAAEPTRCLALTRDVVRGLVQREPDVALALLARLAARVRHLVERLDERAAHGTRARLAALVLARHRTTGARSFTLGGSQQEVAEELGTVRELVVRGLRALREAGAIRAAGGGRYVVLDEALLRRLAE
ncbi:MAG TPA: Crp/Fnr family transcriptional regulator [Gemmatimonadaceae bacterium]|nr:Crp/Fnr family transcriptional regulator [Gemmatimonadaceae bacterium]